MADTLTNERLQLAADRLGGLEEIDRSTYPEFFDDAGILANAARQLLSRRTAPAEPVAWQSMDTAPLDGKHCILAVPEPSGFIYSVQGAYQDGKWNAVHRNDVVPIAWMPNIRLPDAMRGALLAALGGHHD